MDQPRSPQLEGLDGRERAKWLPFGTAERAEAAAVYGDEVVSDSWVYASEFLHSAFVTRPRPTCAERLVCSHPQPPMPARSSKRTVTGLAVVTSQPLRGHRLFSSTARVAGPTTPSARRHGFEAVGVCSLGACAAFAESTVGSASQVRRSDGFAPGAVQLDVGSSYR
jgi:hypothetical protein